MFVIITMSDLINCKFDQFDFFFLMYGGLAKAESYTVYEYTVAGNSAFHSIRDVYPAD